MTHEDRSRGPSDGLLALALVGLAVVFGLLSLAKESPQIAAEAVIYLVIAGGFFWWQRRAPRDRHHPPDAD
jgi:hypothetical protein